MKIHIMLTAYRNTYTYYYRCRCHPRYRCVAYSICVQYTLKNVNAKTRQIREVEVLIKINY